jgi:hypothetical protein
MKNKNVLVILFLGVVFVLLTSMLFESTFIEGYKNMPPIGRGAGIGGVGYDLDYSYSKPLNNDKYGNMRYPGRAFLGVTNGKKEFSYDNTSDDSPLTYDFLSLNKIFG